MLFAAESRYHWFPSSTDTRGNGYLLSLSYLSLSLSLSIFLSASFLPLPSPAPTAALLFFSLYLYPLVFRRSTIMPGKYYDFPFRVQGAS